MSAHYFNSLGGYSIGLPEIPVIDSNGNLVTNVLTNGNVAANVVYTNYLRYGNGQPYRFVGGNNTQLQYNNNGDFGGIPTATYSNGILNLGDTSTLRIEGGINGYYLQTDGLGNISWVVGTGQAGNGNPGGSNTQLQFNDGGFFGASANFTFNKTTNTVNLVNLTANGNVNLGSVNRLSILGGSDGLVLTTDGNGTLSWTPGGGSASPGGSNTQVQFNDDEFFAGDSLFTYDKTTSTLSVPVISANTIEANNFQTSGDITANIIQANTSANILGNLTVSGNIDFANSSNITIGSASNLHISGGNAGYVLSTNGSGNLSWEPQTAPGGSNTQIQFNDSGSFGGISDFTFDRDTNTLNIDGNLVANSLQLGSGIYNWSTSKVHFSTTNTVDKHVLFTTPISNISGIEFHIIATNPFDATRHSVKINSVTYQNIVQYNEYAGLYINGGVGTFSVEYDTGNIQLCVIPDSGNVTSYKMLITIFSE